MTVNLLIWNAMIFKKTLMKREKLAAGIDDFYYSKLWQSCMAATVMLGIEQTMRIIFRKEQDIQLVYIRNTEVIETRMKQKTYESVAVDGSLRARLGPGNELRLTVTEP